MNENRHAGWDAARDGNFFRIVAGLFPPRFLAGASVLLASYDDAQSTEPAEITVASPRRAAEATSPVQL